MRRNYFRKGVLSRGVIGAIFCVSIMLASMATAIDISKKQSSNYKEIDSLDYIFQFQPPSKKITIANNQDFTKVEMKGCIGIGSTAGEPTLPKKPVSILLPPMKTVKDIEIIGEPIIFDNCEEPVIPYQNPVPFGSEQNDFLMSNSLYSSDINYPGTLNEDYQIGYCRGYTILNVVLNPVQYNPAQNKIFYYPEMKVEVELKDTNEMNKFYRNNQKDKAWVENLVYNLEIFDEYTPELAMFDYPGGLCDPGDNYNYVIITTEYNGLDYWDTSSSKPYNWESLMDKHESDDGFSCTLVTIQDIEACSDYENSNPVFNDQEAHIREFCKDAYQDWGTEYILIGGDDESSYIPAREMDTNYEGYIDSDIYWSNLDNNFNDDEDYYWGEEGDDGFDLYSEIYIGRVTCDEPQDVSNWLTKSFYYADCIEPEFLECAGFYGGNTGWNCQGDDFMDYSAIKGTDDWLGPIPGSDGPFPAWAGFQFGFETWNQENPENLYDISEAWTAEPPNPGWQGGSESAAISGFKNAINNNKIALASGIAHANSQMSLDVGSSSWESQYHNTKPFFLHDYGCHCGDMDASDDGVLHSMLFHSDTELAFAVVYNTCYGWGNYDTTNSSSAFQAKEFWSFMLDMENKSEDFDNWRLGIAHAYSKDRMAPTINWDYSTGTWRAIIQGCLLFGDPAQQIKTPHPSEKPLKPDAPDGPSQWILDVECSFSAVTTDPEGEGIYYLFDWGDGNNSGWLGPYASGQTIQAEHAWSELGDYAVKVKAKDIWGVSSDWSEDLTLTIVEDEPPDMPVISGSKIVIGGVEYKFSFTAEDPEGHDLFYKIDWDDGEIIDWIGPYSSGETILLDHTWNKRGEYFIKAWAKDIFGKKSSQGWLKINVIASKTKNVQIIFILEKILESRPLLSRILNLI